MMSLDRALLALPETADELEALSPNARVPMKHALALCFKPDDINEGRACVEEIFARYRSGVRQRIESSVIFFGLILAMVGVGVQKALASGYWPIAVVILLVWVFAAVNRFRSIRAEYGSRFGELAYADPDLPVEVQPFVEAGPFCGYLAKLKQEALSPWVIIGDLQSQYPPVVLREISAARGR